MARMPGAIWRPISRNYTARRTTKDCILLHSTGTNNATSQHGWFNTPGAQASSHFHVAFDGTIEQYIDTDHFSWANSAANSRSVTIETQGNGYGPWTNAQIRSIVSIIQWVRSVHKGIPLRQMTSSAATQKGIGWHRLGCDGNFPKTGILRGRNQRGVGQKWTKHYGKICPGDDRIKQIPAIIRQAGGHATPATAAITPKGQLSMSDINKILKELSTIKAEVGAANRRIDSVAAENRDLHNDDSVAALTRHAVKTTRLDDGRNLDTRIVGIHADQQRIKISLSEIRDMVEQLAEGTGVEIDYNRVEQAAKAGASDAIAEGIEINITANTQTKGEN